MNSTFSREKLLRSLLCINDLHPILWHVILSGDLTRAVDRDAALNSGARVEGRNHLHARPRHVCVNQHHRGYVNSSAGILENGNQTVTLKNI